MQPVHSPIEVDRRGWHLDKTLNVTHILTTMVIAGSLFSYANNMDRRVAVLEEKMQMQALENQRSTAEVRELASDVKHEIRLLRTELMQIVRAKANGDKP